MAVKRQETHGDSDYIPWQLGFTFFWVLITVAGMFIGGMFGSPMRGALWALGLLTVFYGTVFTYNRIRYGIWGLR